LKVDYPASDSEKPLTTNETGNESANLINLSEKVIEYVDVPQFGSSPSFIDAETSPTTRKAQQKNVAGIGRCSNEDSRFGMGTAVLDPELPTPCSILLPKQGLGGYFARRSPDSPPSKG
jgi:hypothetical protein